jgi:nucleoid-associated protein YgaU
MLCIAGPVAVLTAVERLAPPGVAWGDLWHWLGATSPEAALIALAAVVVKLAAVWVLVTTIFTGLAVLGGGVRVTAISSRFALPAVRRLALAAATRLAAVSLAVTPTVAPAAANAVHTTSAPSAAMSVVADEPDHPLPPFVVIDPGEGDLSAEVSGTPTTPTAVDEPDHPLPPFLVIAPSDGDLPAVVVGDDARTDDATSDVTTDTRPTPIPPFLRTEGGGRSPVATAPAVSAIGGGATSYTVVAGDHLWAIAGRRLTEMSGRHPDQSDLARYWVRVVDANRSRIRSGDPDLIFPGEVIELPEVETGTG